MGSAGRWIAVTFVTVTGPVKAAVAPNASARTIAVKVVILMRGLLAFLVKNFVRHERSCGWTFKSILALFRTSMSGHIYFRRRNSQSGRTIAASSAGSGMVVSSVKSGDSA